MIEISYAYYVFPSRTVDVIPMQQVLMSVYLHACCVYECLFITGSQFNFQNNSIFTFWSQLRVLVTTVTAECFSDYKQACC